LYSQKQVWLSNFENYADQKHTWTLELVLSALTSMQSRYAQKANSAMKMLSPPYIARTSNFMALAFQLKADEAQKLLPADVKIKSDDSGMASGGMEIYTTDQIYGVPGYTIAFSMW
jgi:hypothetical protein